MMRFLFMVIVLTGALYACKTDGSKDGDYVDSLVSKVDSLAVSDSVTLTKEYNFYLNDDDVEIYTEAEIAAKFPGGKKALAGFIVKELSYPKKSIEESSAGTVFVSFIVSDNGSVENVEVINPLDDGLLNAEAARVVRNMPEWNPGEIRNEAVNLRYILPVSFSLKR